MKSTLTDILDVIRHLGKLDRKGREHVKRYLENDLKEEAKKSERKKPSTKGEEGA